MRKKIVSGLLAGLCLSGCSPLGEAFNPPVREITLSQAFTDIGVGFTQLRHELAGRPLGLFPCKLAVTLNINASATEDGKLAVGDISNLGFETGRTETRGRTNQVAVELYNPACLPEKTAGYSAPASIQELKMGMIIRESELSGAAARPTRDSETD